MLNDMRCHEAHFPVIVIGAGPIGLTLSNLLGTYGMDILLVDRNKNAVQEPRAVSIDDESLRVMQACGMIDEVLTQIVAGYGSEYYTPGGTCFLKVEPKAQPYGYPRRNAFRQPVLEAQLRSGLDRFENVKTKYGWTLKDYSQDQDRVRLEICNEAGESTFISCDYLVGCDGANSFVRNHLGIMLEGETFSEKWLIVDLENSPVANRETQVFCDTRRPCIALPGPNATRRFEFKLLPGETTDNITTTQTVSALLATPVYNVAPGSIIKRKVVYTFHARLAPTWNVGRVFLAGDACHLTPPFAGQGMNSGIRDAFNLAWKLNYVLHGRLGPALLGTYECERRAHVGEMIDLALRMGRIMGPKNRMHGIITQTLFRISALWPNLRDYFAEMKYKPQPRFSEGFLLADGASAKTTCVGRLLPQPTVRDAHGVLRKLDDILGDGFALLALTDEPEKFYRATRNEFFERLNIRRIAVTTKQCEGVTSITDESGVLAALLHAPGGPLVLVRPDRYVAARSALDDAGGMAGKLTKFIAGARARIHASWVA